MPANPATTFLGGLPRPRPWPVLLTGLGITALGLGFALGEAAAPFRFVPFLAGLILAGAGVSLRFKTAGQAFEERLETAGVLAVAAFAALLAFLGTDPAWDSMELVLVVMIVVALVAVVLVLLPKPIRMIAGGLLILVHFGAILTAATAIDPLNGGAPWISRKLSVVYYPYLQFMYLNNAYHFYSPDPGPPSVVWFHIKYQDGKVKWFKIPNRDEDAVQLHHTRLLSVTESTSNFYQQLPWDANVLTAIRASREQAGKDYNLPLDESIMPINAQYQEALPYSQKMIESYVRHVADTYPSLGDPANTVKSIKVYRFRQTIIDMKSMAEGADPQDKRLFIGYYEGEYDKDGALLRPDVVKDGKLLRRTDPFRFWYMPIYYRASDHVLVDYLTKHARLDLDKTESEQTHDPNDSPWGKAEEWKP